MYSHPHSPGPSGSQHTGPNGYGPTGPAYTVPGTGPANAAPAQHVQGAHPVPYYEQQPQFALPKRWRYKPRRAFWESKALRAGALIGLLALCGLVILAIVRQQTGTEGFLVGVALAILPVPLLVGTFLWVDRVEPQPWRNLVFCFAWGACAATLVALLANSFATHLLTTTFTSNPSESDTWGGTFVAPLVEETCKGTAVLLIFLFRRRDVQGIVDGVVVAGITATGFAFTENILYIGNAFGEDQVLGSTGLGSTTIATFFIRVIMSPFAHPLFTSMTGVGFGIAAMSRRGQARRWLAPLGGWAIAMLLHGIWNGSSSLGRFGFLLIYAAFMVPVFTLLAWLAVWSRGNELRTIRAQLPVYAMAGWLSPLEPLALSSLKARKLARDLARRARGPAGARAVREYQSFATSLAFLRARAARGDADPDFTTREQELLHHMWQRKALAQPLLTQAAYSVHPPVPPQWPGPQVPPPYYGPGPYGPYGR
ncbi:PrsW family intramembrane metalloprotease [Streptomyces sp. NPDC020096]